MEKTMYLKPSVEVIDVAVEKGFATSGAGQTTGTIEDVPMHGWK